MAQVFVGDAAPRRLPEQAKDAPVGVTERNEFLAGEVDIYLRTSDGLQPNRDGLQPTSDGL